MKQVVETDVHVHIINCDTDPFVPNGWSVEKHRKGGTLKWNKDAQKDALYFSEKQKNGGRIGGKDLCRELENKPVLNANVLDYLLAHPHLIPEEWKGKAVFFWGTIYCDESGDLRVRYLLWFGGRWDWDAHWLDCGWGGNGPAAVPAS